LRKRLLRHRKLVIGHAVVKLQEPSRHAAIHPVQRVASSDVLELQ
jgi:hypothetical protein